MLLLATVNDKLQLVTDAAAAVDVHASYVDLAGSAVTPDRKNTAITTAATTDIVLSPAASTIRNVKTIHARNKHATLSVTVTVLFDENGTDYELHRVALAPGDSLEYIEGVGWFTLAAKPTVDPSGNASTSTITANAADTYLLGFNVGAGRLQAGAFFRWAFRASKTAAGTAAPAYNIRFGVNGTTGDTARVTLNGPAQTAAADTGFFVVEAVVRTHGANGIIQAHACVQHQLAATGFANNASQDITGTSAAFDTTVANSIIGISVNPGASGVWTIETVTLDAVNLIK